MGEDAKVAIRNQRRDANEMLKEYDEGRRHHRGRREAGLEEGAGRHRQGLAKVDEIVTKKEAEIMEV